MRIDENIKNEIIKRIIKYEKPIKIILFGSYASGASNIDSESDIDLVIIEKKVVSKIKKSIEIWKLLKDIPIAKDIIVSTPEEFDFYKNEPGSILKTINEKGIVIYGK